MLFNTLQFAIFFVIVYGLYLILNHKWQNRMLLVASYIFYGSWDWRFLSLIFISTLLDYVCGIKIYESKDAKKRKLFLILSIFGNLSILGFFKYFNFFASSLQILLSHFGISAQPRFLHIILPVGISFYTFQTMSYSIDVYRDNMKPTRNFLDYALFVAYFPQLVAGPIERAKHLLPQVTSIRKVTLDKFWEGSHLIFWGLFQKVFIADNLARIVDPVFNSSSAYSGATVLLALYAFAFQIFCDFAGYSNIARGLGKCMGFDIMLNFNLPYFATNPKEFWQRWHISLSTWLKDYLYIPLGGNKKGTLNTYKNLAITMVLGGLWHGASWTFVIWGAYHGLLLIIYRLSKTLFDKISPLKNIFISKICFILKVIFFFHLVCLGWLVFRARSMTQAFNMIHSLFFNFSITSINIIEIKKLVFYLWFLILLDVISYKSKDLDILVKLPAFIRVNAWLYIIYSIIIMGVLYGKEFIYFQF